jgi:transketolase
MALEPLTDKFKAFGWYVMQINGHDFSQIINALLRFKGVKKQPTVIIAKTTKGKGVSIFENDNRFHGVAPNYEEYKIAMEELSKDSQQQF